MTPAWRMLVYIAGLASAPGLGWAQVDALKHDPFARPILLKATPPPSAASRNGEGSGTGTVSQPAWKPELAAVMVAGPRSAVSIEGTIVRIGEEINGHRLTQVHEQTATFVRNGKSVTLSLRGFESAPAAANAGKDSRVTPSRADTPSQQDKPEDRGTSERRDGKKPEEK